MLSRGKLLSFNLLILSVLVAVKHFEKPLKSSCVEDLSQIHPCFEMRLFQCSGFMRCGNRTTTVPSSSSEGLKNVKQKTHTSRTLSLLGRSHRYETQTYGTFAGGVVGGVRRRPVILEQCRTRKEKPQFRNSGQYCIRLEDAIHPPHKQL